MDFNKVWQNFLDTVTNHYVDFNGRVGRTQFWYYVLVVFVIGFIVGIVGSVIHVTALSSLLSLALLLPNLGMGVRRLHDTGKPGIYIVIMLIPAALWILMAIFSAMALMMGSGMGFFAVIAGFSFLILIVTLAALGVMIYFWAQPGQTGDNQYGPAPAAWTPN
jgi:uncharacterized membrane protein YhaH (DUF805 family)